MISAFFTSASYMYTVPCERSAGATVSSAARDTPVMASCSQQSLQLPNDSKTIKRPYYTQKTRFLIEEQYKRDLFPLWRALCPGRPEEHAVREVTWQEGRNGLCVNGGGSKRTNLSLRRAVLSPGSS